MTSRTPFVYVLVLVGSCLAACDRVRTSPQLIDADGRSYVACSGLVWASGNGGLFSDDTSFKVTFIDPGRKKHTIWGVKKLSIQEPPAESFAPFPQAVPDPRVSIDQNGQQYVNGIYTWSDGSKAELSNGMWKPVPISTACGT